MGVISPTPAFRNMKDTMEFYKKSLGFTMVMAFPDADNPEYADLSKDGMVLMFIPAENVGIGNDKKLGTGVNRYIDKMLESNRVESYLDIKAFHE